MSAPECCPNCGAEVPPNAKACPECGSDEHTGWSEAAENDGLGLPDGEFDYDKFVQKEFGPESPVPRGISRIWWLVGFILLAGLLLLVFAR